MAHAPAKPSGPRGPVPPAVPPPAAPVGEGPRRTPPLVPDPPAPEPQRELVLKDWQRDILVQLLRNVNEGLFGGMGGSRFDGDQLRTHIRAALRLSTSEISVVDGLITRFISPFVTLPGWDQASETVVLPPSSGLGGPGGPTTGPGGTGAGGPGPVGTGLGGATTQNQDELDFTFDRSRLTNETMAREVMQRVFGGGLGASARGDLFNRFRRFQGQFPITQLGRGTEDLGNIDFQQGFENFLRNPAATGSQLGQTLRTGISNAGGEDTGPAEFLRGLFGVSSPGVSGFGSINPAVTAALQPMLANISPMFRQNFSNFATDRFRDVFSANPESFADDPLAVFRYFQERGFF